MGDVKDLDLHAIIGFDGNAPNGLLFHPDGSHIVYPFGVKIATQHLHESKRSYFEGHTNVISALAVSKTGKYIASGQINHMGFKAPVIVWDWETRSKLMRHESHKVRIESVAFSSCENFVISLGGKDDTNVVVYNVNTKEAICCTFSSNKNAGDALTVAAMNLRGICFITAGVLTLKVWTLNPANRVVSGVDVLTRKIKRKVTCIKIDEKDELAWCGTSTGDLMKVKLNFGKDLENCVPLVPPSLVACYGKHPKRKDQEADLWGQGVRALILVDTTRKLVGAGDGNIELVDEKEYVTDGMKKSSKLSIPTLPLFVVLKRTRVGSLVTSMQLMPGGKVLIGVISCEMFILDLNTFNTKMIMTCHTSAIFDVRYPSDYSEVFATASKNDVRIWGVAQGKELLRISVPNFTCSGVLFAHDGTCLWSSWNDGSILAFTPQTGKLRHKINNAHNKGVSALAATRNGRLLLSGGVEGQIRLWDIRTETQKLAAVLKEHNGPVSSIDVALNDKEAASASTDGTCIIWDLEKHVRIAILFSQTLFMGVKYHPSGCQLITCGTNRQIGYWEVFDGSLIREVEGSLSAALNSLAISSDGRFIVTGGTDTYVKVWLYKEGITTHVGLGHGAVVTSVAIAPNCQSIVSCSADGAIFIWNSPYISLDAENKAAAIENKQKKKSENVKAISQKQNVHSASPQDGKQPPSTQEGSVKCYCEGACKCVKGDLPKSPNTTKDHECHCDSTLLSLGGGDQERSKTKPPSGSIAVGAS